MAFEYEKLVVEQDGAVVVAAINHPPANAMAQGVLRDLNDLLNQCEKDDSVRVLIITGTGPKCFSAGADITEFADLQSGKVPPYDGNDVYFKIENYPKIVIAAIQGLALGGGLELACACHLRIMAEEAVVGLPEVLEAAKKLAKKLAGGAPVAQREIMKAVRLGLEGTLHDGITKVEKAAFQTLLVSEDFKEGARAFLEKRPAQFKGR